MTAWSVVQNVGTGEAEWERLREPDREEVHGGLRDAGWTVEGGQCGTDFYWEVDEAVEVAGR